MQDRQQGRDRAQGRTLKLAKRSKIEGDHAHVLDAREHRAERCELGELADFFLRGLCALSRGQPVTLDAPAVAAPDIRVEVRRGTSAIIVNWPLQGAGSCAQWLREWLK